MLVCDKPCKLLEETVALLKADSRDLPTIYVETGIPYHWLKALYYGRIKNPSVNRVCYLREQLLRR